MEGVGARLGRSSTRYGPATVFTGPVRKWKKQWIHVTPSPASSNSNTNHNHNHSHSSNTSHHLLLYKWTPITQSHNTTTNNNNSNTATANGNAKDAPAEQPEEPPRRRKFKYVPVFKLHCSPRFLIRLFLGFNTNISDVFVKCFLHWMVWIACSSDYNILIICVLFCFSCFLLVPFSWSTIETCFLMLIFF